MFNFVYSNILFNVAIKSVRQNFTPLRQCNVKIIARFTTSSTFQNTFDLSILDKEEIRYWNFLESNDSFLKNNFGINDNEVKQINTLLRQKKEFETYLKNVDSLSSDTELKELILIEKINYLKKIENIKNEIFKIVLHNEGEKNKNVELQILPGIGGAESKLFAEEIYNMYLNFILYKNWVCLGADLKSDRSEFKSAYIYISGNSVYDNLKHEGGVHRVQRVPETEKSGRTHTSTCAVVVLPQPEVHEIIINDKDVLIEKIRSSGPGGQNVNKTESCVRIKHIPTGITVENQTSRHQHENKIMAFERLKGILYDLDQKKANLGRKALAKEQMITNDYSDKIRTYNFNQNRVTDHRIGYTTHNVKSFLKGEKDLDEMIKHLKEFNRKKMLSNHIKTVLQSEDFQNFEKQNSN